ncbi:unnamed protein product [Gadus morhua 'NCC']
MVDALDRTTKEKLPVSVPTVCATCQQEEHAGTVTSPQASRKYSPALAPSRRLPASPVVTEGQEEKEQRRVRRTGADNLEPAALAMRQLTHNASVQKLVKG